MKGFMYLHKNGVFFTKVADSHLKFLYRLKRESWWGTHNTLVTNIQDQEKWFKNIPNDSLFLAGYHRCTLKGVAVYTNIDYVSRTLSISGSVAKQYRKTSVALRGFSAGVDFAFEMLNMHRLNAEVLETNVASLKLQLSQGFKIEGRRRKAVYKSGRYYDSIITGILREEWESNPRVVSYGGICNLNFNLEKANESIENINSL